MPPSHLVPPRPHLVPDDVVTSSRTTSPYKGGVEGRGRLDDLDPATSSRPSITAELRRLADGSHIWHVPTCPLCTRSHDYAAGAADRDPHDALGLRLSLCAGRAHWFTLEAEEPPS